MAKTFKHSLSLRKSSLNQIATVSLNANVRERERDRQCSLCMKVVLQTSLNVSFNVRMIYRCVE